MTIEHFENQSKAERVPRNANCEVMRRENEMENGEGGHLYENFV